jgi:predicted ATP-dependent serine protease
VTAVGHKYPCTKCKKLCQHWSGMCQECRGYVQKKPKKKYMKAEAKDQPNDRACLVSLAPISVDHFE